MVQLTATLQLLAAVLAAALALCVGATSSATSSVAAYTLADCRPRAGMRQGLCGPLARWCSQQGVPMSWVGTGCTITSGVHAGEKANDAGCQCGLAKE